MNKSDLDKFLGSEMVITDIFEDDLSIYAFYTSKTFYDTDNDLYKPIGIGPLFYDKKKNQLLKLGSLEFYQDHSHKDIFKEKMNNTESIDYKTLINKINKRNRVNFEEYEYIMNFLDIPFDEIMIYSEDFESTFIESEKEKYLDLFEEFFNETNIKVNRINLKRLIIEGAGAS